MKKIQITEFEGLYTVYLKRPTYWNPHKEERLITTKNMTTIVDFVKFYGLMNIMSTTAIYDKIRVALDSEK